MDEQIAVRSLFSIYVLIAYIKKLYPAQDYGLLNLPELPEGTISGAAAHPQFECT